ncbi:MAG: hypothetical protein Q9162_004647 [Coniocarpon cinnabarinum]
MLATAFFCFISLFAFVAAVPTASVQPRQDSDFFEPASSTLDASLVEARGAHWHGHQGDSNDEDDLCDLSSVSLPSSTSSPLPSPSGTLTHVAVGRGTQNYTCDPSNPQASPSAVGAVANLYDASCAASADSDDALMGMKLLGHHYFVDPSSPSPAFNLDTSNGDAGYVNVKSGSKVSAPSGAPVGQSGQGFGAVPWLSLPQKSGPQGAPGQQSFSSVYRVNTAGGQSPSSCENMPSAFEIQYAAEYWFYK